MARIRSSSASQTATVPVRTLSLVTVLLVFVGILYMIYLFVGSNSTIHTPHNVMKPSQQQFHSKTTSHLHQNSKNRIVQENMKQGTPRSVWWTNQTAGEPLIEGFTNEFSYFPGEDIQFKLHSEELLLRSSIARYVHPDDPIQVWIFRLGYYNASGAILVGKVSYPGYKSHRQPPCLYEPSSRLVDCDHWTVSTQWTVPLTAISGVYIALPVYRLSGQRARKYHLQHATKINFTTAAHADTSASSYGNREDEWMKGSYIPFVVRDTYVTRQNLSASSTASSSALPAALPAATTTHYRGSDVLFKTADTTWVAYNKYGGWNVYRGNGSIGFDSRSYKASYNRPFQNRMFKHRGQYDNFLFGSEYPLLYWLEQQGYDVTYASCSDVEDLYGKGVLVPRYHRVLLSVGHDEYYTQTLRDAFVNARDHGVHLAFFSANEVFWRTRWEGESSSSKTTQTNSNHASTHADVHTGTHGSSPSMPRSRHSSHVVTTLTQDIHPIRFRKGMSWKIEESEDHLLGQTVFQEILSRRANPQLYPATTTTAAAVLPLNPPWQHHRRRLISLSAGMSGREVVGEIAGITTHQEGMKDGAKGKEMKTILNTNMAGEVAKKKKNGVVPTILNKIVHNKALANQAATLGSGDSSSSATISSASLSTASSASSAMGKRRWGSGGIDSLKDSPHLPSVTYDKASHDKGKMKGSKPFGGKQEGRREAYQGDEGGVWTGTGKEKREGNEAKINPLIAATWQPPPSTTSSMESQSGQGLGPAPGQGLGPNLSRHVIRVRAHRVFTCAKETIDNTPYPLDLTTSASYHSIVSPINKENNTKNTTNTSHKNNSNHNNHSHSNNHTTDTAVNGFESVSVRWTGSFTDPRFRTPLSEHALTGQKFAVNGYRFDALEVGLGDALLRFWRHTPLQMIARRYLEDVGSRGGGGNWNVSRGKNMTFVSGSGRGVGGVVGDNNRINISSIGTVEGDSVVNIGGSRKSNSSIRGSTGSGGVDVIDWSYPIYRSVRGYLGYEWGTFSDNCHKPPGLWPLSTTTHTIPHGLVEKYGALYHGSGTVTHRLSLYRTQPSRRMRMVISGTTLRSGEEKHLVQYEDKALGQHKGKGSNQLPMSPSALVFGAGTVQWSFALSSFHDGRHIPTDVNIQQATMNLLADMQCYPHTPDKSTLHIEVALTDQDKVLDQDNDKTPPTSTLLFPTSVTQSHTVRKSVSLNSASTTTHPVYGPVYIAQDLLTLSSTGTGDKQRIGKDGLDSIPSPTVIVISESTVSHLGVTKNQSNEKKGSNNNDKTKQKAKEKNHVKNQDNDKSKSQKFILNQSNDKDSSGVSGFVIFSPEAMSWSVDTSTRARTSPTDSRTTRARSDNNTMVLTITMPSSTTTPPIHTNTTTRAKVPSPRHRTATNVTMVMTGLAWDLPPIRKGVSFPSSGIGTVAGVEVSIDGGQTWRQARWTPGLGATQKSGLGPVLRSGHKRMWERAFPLWPMPMEEDPLLCPHTDRHTQMLYQEMELHIVHTDHHNNTTTAATASPIVTTSLVTLNVSSRAVDDSGWLQQDLIWTTVHIIL